VEQPPSESRFAHTIHSWIIKLGLDRVSECFTEISLYVISLE
jgi:hypothetical protein